MMGILGMVEDIPVEVMREGVQVGASARWRPCCPGGVVAVGGAAWHRSSRIDPSRVACRVGNSSAEMCYTTMRPPLPCPQWEVNGVEWESFPQWLDALDAMPLALDIAAMVPHSAVRPSVRSVECSLHAL